MRYASSESSLWSGASCGESLGADHEATGSRRHRKHARNHSVNWQKRRWFGGHSRGDPRKAIGRVVGAAEAVGMSDETINNVGYRLGEFLAGNIDPGNREQRLLKELWEVGSEDEKRALTKMIAKLADRDVEEH